MLVGMMTGWWPFVVLWDYPTYERNRGLWASDHEFWSVSAAGEPRRRPCANGWGFCD